MCNTYDTPLLWLPAALVGGSNRPRYSLRGAVEKNIMKVNVLWNVFHVSSYTKSAGCEIFQIEINA